MPNPMRSEATEAPRFADSASSLERELARAEADSREALRRVNRLRLRGASFTDFSAAIRAAGQAHSRVEMLQREVQGLR
jgi:hypothetical protein